MAKLDLNRNQCGGTVVVRPAPHAQRLCQRQLPWSWPARPAGQCTGVQPPSLPFPLLLSSQTCAPACLPACRLCPSAGREAPRDGAGEWWALM